jgi:hypothetical protein
MPPKGAPIPQDHDRFRYLAPEAHARDSMPLSYRAPLETVPTRTLIARRLASLKSSTAAIQILG